MALLPDQKGFFSAGWDGNALVRWVMQEEDLTQTAIAMGSEYRPCGAQFPFAGGPTFRYCIKTTIYGA